MRRTSLSSFHLRSCLLLCALSCAIGPSSARAEGPDLPQTLAAPAPAARPKEVVGYVTQSDRRLPLLEFAPYQTARHLWTAGFIAALSGIAVMGTGVGVMLVGTQTGGFSAEAQHKGLLAGGVLVGIGAAATGIGATLWYLGRREVTDIEEHLPTRNGIIPPSALSPSLSLLPEGKGGSRVLAGLSGTF